MSNPAPIPPDGDLTGAATTAPPDGEPRPGVPARPRPEGESAFMGLIECNADGVLVVDPDGVVRYANRAAEALLGRPRGELVGRIFGTPVVPGETAEVDLVGPPEADGTPAEVRFAEMRSESVTWEGRPALIASLRDVTARKQAEEALRFLAEAGRELAQSLDEPTTLATITRLATAHLGDACLVYRVEPDGRLHCVASAHGDEEKLKGLRLCQPAEGIDPNAAEVPAAVVRTGKPYACPAVPGARSAAEGEVHPRGLAEAGFRSYLCVPLVVRGKTLGALAVVRTAPSRRYAPADVTLAEDFAHRAAAALENARLYAESQDENRRKAEFVAMLGHELRNPLAAIRNALHVQQLASPKQEGKQDAPARAWAVAERQVRHMARLIDDLLEASRVSRGLIRLRRERLDLRTAVENAAVTCRPMIDQNRHRFQISVPPEPLWVDADPARLEQVVGNLLHNAAKYTDPGGRITLSAWAQGNEALVAVEDDGIGIPAAVLPKLFELFSAGPQALDRSRGGLGIGLTLARKLVEMHGGTVQAFSDGEGKGSRFVVRLALAEPPAEVTPPAPPAENSAAPAAPTAAATPGAKTRLLLVEDGTDIREMLQMLLRYWGYEVGTASDGKEGLERLLAERPPVALVDIGLPGMNGFEVARRLREAERASPAPDGSKVYLIAITGYAHEDDCRLANEAGFDVHLTKPVDPAELKRLLTQAAAAGDSAPPA